MGERCTSDEDDGGVASLAILSYHAAIMEERRMRRALRVFPTLLIAAVFAAGCKSSQSSSATTAPSEPILVVVYDGGLPVIEFDNPDKPMSRSSGVRLAVWEDGVVLFTENPRHPTHDMRIGRLSPAELARANRQLLGTGLHLHPDVSRVFPDGTYVSVRFVHRESVTKHTLYEFEQGWPAWWPQVLSTLESFIPVESQPISKVATDGEFRGYVPHAWFRTPWARR